jgi:hypothetical protein
MIETSLKQLDLGFYEMQFAFEGLADENVWKRPFQGLLSIGELAGHHAYWEAIRLAGDGEDLAKCAISSPLVDKRFRYYPDTLATTPLDVHLTMTAKQVYEELLLVHETAVAHLKKLNPSPHTPIPGDANGFTYGAYLDYAAFHIAYHTGQMYSVRHLLGEATPNN